MPIGVTLPAGAVSATITITTNDVAPDAVVSISATLDTNVRTATVLVTASAPTVDTVSISRVEYDPGKGELRIEASSSDNATTLNVYITSTDQLIGTLDGDKGRLSWPTNPVNVTVRSSLGGSANEAVNLK